MPDATAERVAGIILTQIIANHGAPEIIQTDRGTNFTSHVIKSVNAQLNKTHKLSTAYHPQSHGSLERQHGPLKAALTMYANSHQTNWDATLPLVKIAMNSNPHEAHGYTPFFVMTGEEPLFPGETTLPRIEFPIQDYISHFHQIYNSVQKKLTASQEMSRKLKLKSMTPHFFYRRFGSLSPSKSHPWTFKFLFLSLSWSFTNY